MMFMTQTERISIAKNRAFKVFHDTKKKFEKAIEEAKAFIAENEAEAERLYSELSEKKDTNFVLNEQVASMENTINQIDKFIGA